MPTLVEGSTDVPVDRLPEGDGRLASRAVPTVLAPADYVDPAVFDRDRWSIFARHWWFVADAASLAGGGSYRAVTVAGFPVLVVNDGGTLRAFHNVCRHRGGPLAWDGDGRCTRLVCRYHGWAYGLDGRLQSARDFQADDEDTAGLSLGAARVDTWRGLVFVNLDVDADPVRRWLADVAGECRPYPMEEFELRHRCGHDLAANWKLYAENYMEGYHIPLVHPGLNRQIDARRYDVEVRGEAAVHRAPPRDGSVTTGTWLWRFPGFALNLYERGMCVESAVPTGPTTTRVDYSFFFAPGTPDRDVGAAVSSSTTILDEDRVICEAVQRAMASGLYRGGVLSPRHEAGVAAVQRAVRDSAPRA